jgi:hypothetical protein
MRKLLFGCLILTLAFTGCKHYPTYPDITEIPIRSFNCSSDSVYFQNQIAPLLSSNCAMSGCHDSHDSRAGIDVTSYVSLMNSNIIKRGNANRSNLYKVLHANGDNLMPPSPYNALSSDQQALIKKWIDQGAINNQCMECDTNNFTFSNAVLPIFESACVGCHGPGSGDGEYYNYSTISPDTSIIWSDISSDAMPKNLSPLTDCQKTIIKKWMLAGAPNN